MSTTKPGFYSVLVFISYIYFFLVGLVWFYENFNANSNINVIALGIMLVFIIQAYYRNKILNLILGILGLFFSIWVLLEVVAGYNLFAKTAHLDNTGKMLITFGIIDVLMSGILMFSYMMLNKDNH